MKFQRVAMGTACLFLLLLGNRLPAQETSPGISTAPTPRQSPPYIVIKADDLSFNKSSADGVHANWNKFIEICRERKIPATIGIICNSLEAPDNEKYIDWIKTQQSIHLAETAQFEFWNHGWDHKKWTEGEGKEAEVIHEFKDSSYDHQKDHYTRSQNAARIKLGAPFATFGAPFNATDSSTARILQEDPDCKVWLYGDTKSPGGKKVLARTRGMSIEYAPFTPNSKRFKEEYVKNPQAPYFVIQGHPTQWTPARFEEFIKILDFLKSEKAVFITPIEYSKIASP